MGLLRLLLAIAVIVNHMGLPREYMISGGDAVRIFFMISGFYMAMVLLEKYGSTRSGVIKFAENRFLRLYPTYLAVLILTIGWYCLCIWSTGGRTPQFMFLQLSEMIPHWQAALIWMVNFTLAGIDLPSLFHWSRASGFLFMHDLPDVEKNGVFWIGQAVWVRQAWSIGAEICFYSLAPLLVFGSLRRIILIGAGSALVGVIGNRICGPPIYYFWPAELIYFVIGILLYKIYKAVDLQARLPRSPLLRNAIILSPLVWLVLLPTYGVFSSHYLIYGMATISIPVLFEITKRNSFDRFFGNLSYATYLDHLLVSNMVVIFVKRVGISKDATVPLIILGSIVLAFALERLIENPIDKLRARVAAS